MLLSDHVRAAYFCSLHLDVIRNAIKPENIDPKDCLACERLLKKIMDPSGIVGSDESERERER